MQLNGWQRLWVVSVFLYGAVVIVMALREIPTEAVIERQWTNEAFDSIARQTAQPEFKEYASGFRARQHLVGDKSDKEAIDWIRSYGNKDGQIGSSIYWINERYERELKTLPTQQRNISGAALMAWLIPSVLIYLFGWLIAWIVRGFKN